MKHALSIALLTLAALHSAAGSLSAQTAPGAAAATRAAPHGGTPIRDPDATLTGMSPAERVGQLFLVAVFQSEDRADGPDADIVRLITEGKIGGVVLQASSGTVANVPGQDEAAATRRYTAALQDLALGADGPGVPLFVAVDHEGDGAPRTHLREGFTQVPSAMAIGATWDPDNAEAVGAIVGEELAAAGVNLLLGPVLDVLAEPRITQRGDIGVRAFGGDPYWVSRMGAAYVRGVHEGSLGRVATVAKHFPGHGGSDRLPDTEVSTVNKSLAELRRIELPPFQAVTQGPPGSDPSITDGLMTSHIRYRGFQGNIHETTPPISLDRAALGAVLALDPDTLGVWRSADGLVVADSLGVRAIKRWDDPQELTFNHRHIARSALLAGNDLLILAQFAQTKNHQAPWSLQMENILDTLDYFREEYGRDPDFRARVDDAARRILARKAALYPSGWSADETRPPANLQAGRPEAAATAREISRAAVTRLRGDDVEPPGPDDRIVVVTDGTGTLACPKDTCGLGSERLAELLNLGPTLVEGTLLDRFGPGAAGRVRAENLTSVTFCQLQAALVPAGLASGGPEEGLAAATETPADATAASTPAATVDAGCDPPMPRDAVLAALKRANWIVFAYSDLHPVAVPHAEAVPNFLQLAGHVAASRTVRLAALSFGPPYGFETTDFDKLDVVLAAYSKNPASIEASVDALFREYDPPGSSPVTVEADSYDLATVLEADPDATFDLKVVAPEAPAEVTLPARFVVEAGPILDHNGHRVPDGTRVELSVVGAGGVDNPTSSAITRDGMARLEGAVPDGGQVRLQASSGLAQSETRLLDFPRPTAVPPPAPTVAPAVAEPPRAAATPTGMALPDFLMCLASIVLVTAVWIARPGWRRQPMALRLRGWLVLAAGGLAAYVAYGLAVETWSVPRLLEALPHVDAAIAGILGSTVGMAVAYGNRMRLTDSPTWPEPPGPAR